MVVTSHANPTHSSTGGPSDPCTGEESGGNRAAGGNHLTLIIMLTQPPLQMVALVMVMKQLGAIQDGHSKYGY